MPTYEYECENCGFHFERFQGINDKPVKRCSKCRHKVRRLMGTGAGIIFKGSGFYQTDYRSDSYKEGAKREKSESAAKSGDKKKTETVSSGTRAKKTASQKGETS
ncbi:FmdB family zinc ribbon protein [Verrucomicrobiota bacterium]